MGVANGDNLLRVSKRSININTVTPALRDHSGENAKVVSYSRWSFNTGSTIQLKNNVVIDRCYSTTS